ncbi:amiloride-sensitive sodium channel subunit beta-like [Varroa jacobsoni]|uniref:amiloride-sensitive sodium channel subunit beta-like n=1 Tax=Varroa jacobsoni TaxID=62625 RepID=UPI000BF90E41|nr:amiloride-sensitive sodium channel subunit beta-like [Varroa jacobsoni]
MTYFRLPSQMCYTIDMYRKLNNNVNHPMSSCQTPWNYACLNNYQEIIHFADLTVSGQWNPNTTWSLRQGDTLPLIIHEPLMVPPERLSSIMIEPGMDYTISVTQNKIRRLPKPYSSKCVDYQKIGFKDTFYGFLNLDLCIQECRMEIELRLCGCVRTVNEFAHRFQGGVHFCDMARDEMCSRTTASVPGVYAKCDKKCEAPCEEIIYDVRLTSFAEDKSENSRKSFRYTVKFASYSQKILEYQPTLSIVEMFGCMGGYIGIWLGFSLLSVLLGLNELLWKLHKQRHLTTKIVQLTSAIATVASTTETEDRKTTSRPAIDKQTQHVKLFQLKSASGPQLVYR